MTRIQHMIRTAGPLESQARRRAVNKEAHLVHTYPKFTRETNEASLALSHLRLFSGFEVFLDLPLHPLQRVIDGFHMPVQIHGDLLIGFSLQVTGEHLTLQIG